MTDYQIKKLAIKYRNAIESARDDGSFTLSNSFNHFPCGCCGNASSLLAEYLLTNGIETIWYSATRDDDDWSHAWLIVKDNRIKEPTPNTFYWPENIRNTIKKYGINHPEQGVDLTNYRYEDLEEGLIIDITGDQFDDYSVPVYVGQMDPFHKSFDFVQAFKYCTLGDKQLNNLYQIIERYL